MGKAMGKWLVTKQQNYRRVKGVIVASNIRYHLNLYFLGEIEGYFYY